MGRHLAMTENGAFLALIENGVPHNELLLK
jgi:hypothetical protein